MNPPLKPIKLDRVPLHGGLTIGAKLRLCQRTLDRLWEYYCELIRLGTPGVERFSQKDFDAIIFREIEEAFEDLLQQIKKKRRGL